MMKLNRPANLILLALMFVVFFSAAAMAQDNALKLGGEIYIDNRVRTGDGAWSWSENRLDLDLEKGFNNRARMYASVWLRSFGFPLLTSTEQLFNKDEVSPYNIDLREAYVDLYDFLLKGLDLRIGRQRIAWGTADRINPTDNLNPDDLEDIWDFGRHSGSDGFRATYYFSDFYLDAVWLPFFRPAVLPRGDWADALAPPVSFPEGIIINSMTDSLAMPAYNLGESSSYGIKAGGFLKGFDISVSYVYCRDDLPIQYYNTVSFAQPLVSIDIKSDLFFPRQHIFGADMSGAIGPVGVWAEAGVFLPKEEVVMTTDLSQVLQPSQDSVVLEKEVFVKYVLGTDYTFRDGSYLNLQFFHGFVTERGRENLNDYLMLAWEKSVFNDKLKLTPAAGAFIVGDWNDISGNHAWVYAPFITYFPNINTEISLGIRLIGGEGDNMFALVKDKDEVFLSVRFSF